MNIWMNDASIFAIYLDMSIAQYFTFETTKVLPLFSITDAIIKFRTVVDRESTKPSFSKTIYSLNLIIITSVP